MKRIFKYTFLQRLPGIILSCTIMACMSGIELFFLAVIETPFSGFYVLWFILTMIALAVIPLFLFIRCSSGYARTLLFTNESYLMLTLPVRTERMLLGRMLCGLTELVICTLVSWLLSMAIGIDSAYHFGGIKIQNIPRLLNIDLPHFLFIKNFLGLIALLFIFFAAFALIGNVALAVQTALRSFNIKRLRGLWVVGFILGLTGILFFIGTIESKAAEALGDYCPITVYGVTYHNATDFTYISTVVNVPIISIVLSIGLGILCFFISAQLLKKKVEV